MKTIFTYLKPAMIQLFGVILLPGIVIAQSSHSISVSNNVFNPSALTIAAGDTVIWTNVQGYHNVNGSQSIYPNNPESFANALGFGWTYKKVFTVPGKYDYQCDPHVDFGMKGSIIVQETVVSNTLTINFTGMTPHVGQKLFLVVKPKSGGGEVGRAYKTIETNFSIVMPGILSGESYEVEFFADHNGNGSYDAPPADHAWSMDLDNVDGDEVLDFSHNTNFKNIEWEHKVFLNFSAMNPHVGQELYIVLIENESGTEIDRESHKISESFTMDLGNITPGKSYTIDFFADHNSNNRYDAPPADHAWRIMVENAQGDEMIDFSHNTNFTDINWQHQLMISFKGMTPHIGQKLTLYLKDASSKAYLDTIEIASIPSAEFHVSDFRVHPGMSYDIDFYSDHNGNGSYDAPPADHAWRLASGIILGDTELSFTHNTSFTNIFETTGTGLFTDQNSINIYPLPANYELFVNSPDILLEKLEIFDLTGKLRFSTYHGATGTIKIDISDFQKGFYILRAKTADKYFTQKFMVR